MGSWQRGSVAISSAHGVRFAAARVMGLLIFVVRLDLLVAAAECSHGDRLRSSSEVLQQLQRPRRSTVQQMSSVVCFSRYVLLVQAAERRQGSFGTRVLQSSIMGCRFACKSLPQVCPPRVFSADAPCTGSGAPPGFIGFFPEVSRH